MNANLVVRFCLIVLVCGCSANPGIEIDTSDAGFDASVDAAVDMGSEIDLGEQMDAIGPDAMPEDAAQLDDALMDALPTDAIALDAEPGLDAALDASPETDGGSIVEVRASPMAGFTEIYLVRDTTTATDLVTYVRERPGLRFLGIKVPWSRLVVAGTTAVFSDPDGMIDALLNHIHANGLDLRVKLMVQAGPLVPAAIYTDAVHPVREVHKLNVSGSGSGASTSAVAFPLPWDPNLKWHFDAFASSLGTWLSGAFDGVHARTSFIYALQSSMPMTDVNTEMPDSYEGASVLSIADTTTGTLSANLSTAATTIATDIPGCTSGTAANAGLLLIESGACGSTGSNPSAREGIYFTSATCVSGNYTFNVATDASTGATGITGRGWNAGTSVSGAASGPARAFSTGDCVHLRDAAGDDVTPSAYSMPWLGTGDASTDVAVTGLYEISTLNQNLWARTYNLTPSAPWHSYQRSGLSVTLDDVTAEPGDTEASRARLIARAWMDSIDILLTRMPTNVRVWQHGGNMWRFVGSATPLGYNANSPNDAVRDYVRSQSLSRRLRMIWGYTVAYNELTDPSDPTAGLGAWRAQSCFEMADNSVALGIQTEAASNAATSLGHPERAIDYLFAAERLMTVFNTDLRWIESNADRSAFPGDRGQSGHYSVYDAALATYTGVPGILPPQPGSMDDVAGTPIKTFHDMLVGRSLGIPGPGVPSTTPDPIWNANNIDLRLQLLAPGGGT